MILRNIQVTGSGNAYHLRVGFYENIELILSGQEFSSLAEDAF